LIAQFEAQPPTGAAVQQVEVLVRAAVFKPANAVVGYLLQAAADRIDAGYQPHPGQIRKGRASIGIQCLFGSFVLTRDYYYHAGKQQGHYPADAALGLEVSYTPALARLIGLAGAAAASYQQAETQLTETGGLAVSARPIQRVVQRVGQTAQRWQARECQPTECEPCAAPVLYASADGTGAPMRAAELVGRAGQQADGTAKTRQVYLGCVFTQHRRDAQGQPIRAWESTTYVSSLDAVAKFGPLLRQEALRRGMSTAQRVVLLIDGAEGLEHMGRLCFAGDQQIVDFYHALEHAGRVLEALLGSKQQPTYQTRRRQWIKRLLKDQVAMLIAQTRRAAAAAGRSGPVEQELGYFVRNSARMQYGSFRQQGLFIGSGVIEAGCKTIIGSRCKQSGLFWSRTGAENIIALRCIHASRRLDKFWKHRLGEHAARNVSLPLAA
jgi:hypothetical protein